VDFSLIVAVTLSRTGMVHLGRPVQVADATQVPLAQLARFLGEVQRFTNEGERLLIALPPIGSSPITTSIAQTVDAAVLCVLYERMSSSQAKKTIQMVGRARFLGSVIFHQDQIAEADRVR
jgi:Mrp family chromosome partitioning ATPase